MNDLTADVSSGHDVRRTVFIECGASYDKQAPTHLAPVGETRFVAAQAHDDPRHLIGGIVAHADLSDLVHLDEVLDAHAAAAQGLLRGIRDAAASDSDPSSLSIPGRAPAGLYAESTFRTGVSRLGERGLTYDAWHYHHQNREFAALARAVPNTVMVLDHFGTPLGVGSYAGKRDEIFSQWKVDIAEIAKCDNVVAKLGGLAMPDNGFGWHTADSPPTSDEFVALQAPYYQHTIECFGVERCMFESNFPVDKFSLSYRTLWNAFKKMVADYSPRERDALFFDTASRIYQVDSPN